MGRPPRFFIREMGSAIWDQSLGPWALWHQRIWQHKLLEGIAGAHGCAPLRLFGV